MTTADVPDFLARLLENPNGYLWIVPLLALLEAIPGIGLLVSGALLLSVSYLLIATGQVDLFHLVSLAFIGALVSDHIGYYLGYLIGPRIWSIEYLKKHDDNRIRAQRLLTRSAPAAIIVGRLVPAARSITPLVAGVGGIRPASFSTIDALACAIWATGLALLVKGIELL